MGFNYEDTASRWRRGRTLSTEASYGLGLEMKRPPPIYTRSSADHEAWKLFHAEYSGM
jgi:hypothetical protein